MSTPSTNKPTGFRPLDLPGQPERVEAARKSSGTAPSTPQTGPNLGPPRPNTQSDVETRD